MLHLTARSVLHHAKNALESGPARSTAISVAAGTVGLVAGKREDAKKVPIAAIALGALAKVGRFHTIGDGLMSGGATLIGYRVGARMARKERPRSPEMPRMPASAPPVAQRRPQAPAGRPGHQGHKRS
jgi:hypothetical protein